MTRTKQDKKDNWERKRVQRVLDYHNKKYGTGITIKSKFIDVYPHLKEQKSQLNWDWVCYDTKTGDEIAIEVKRLTDPELEEKSNVMWQLLEEVQNSLSESKKLPGTFFLSFDTPQDYYLPFNKKGNKRKLRDIIYKTVYQTAQTLKLGETKDLMPQIEKQLSFTLPDFSPLDLHKFSNEGNALYKSSGITGWDSIHFDKNELTEFEQLVSHANKQLKEANVKDTFLLFIEEGYRPKDPPEIAEAFTRINAASYSEIRRVYFIRGEEVAEIPLPTP